MARGGRRVGKPGSLYPNRTDMAQGARQLPVTTAPGQTYGEAGQQAAAQHIVPMGTPGGPATSPQPQMTQGDAMQASRDYTPPPVIPLNTPTLRPGEHVMTGLNAPTPSPLMASPVLKGVALLNGLGDAASPEVKALRNVLTAQQGNEQAP